MFGKGMILKMVLDWMRTAGGDAIDAAIHELIVKASSDVFYFLSRFPPEILEEALRRAKERKDRENSGGE